MEKSSNSLWLQQHNQIEHGASTNIGLSQKQCMAGQRCSRSSPRPCHMSTSRALIVFGVVVAHLLLASFFLHAAHQALPNRPFGKDNRPDRSQVTVLLLEPYLPIAIKPKHTDRHADARSARASPRSATMTPEPVYGSEKSNTAALSNRLLIERTPDGITARPVAPAASVPQQKQDGATLNLTLSPEALRSLTAPSLAAKSPFQGHLPATVERAIADAASETGPWTEERIDNDHIRWRRGNTCVMLSRPHIANIDPFSDSVRHIPWGAQVSTCR